MGPSPLAAAVVSPPDLPVRPAHCNRSGATYGSHDHRIARHRQRDKNYAARQGWARCRAALDAVLHSESAPGTEVTTTMGTPSRPPDSPPEQHGGRRGLHERTQADLTNVHCRGGRGGECRQSPARAMLPSQGTWVAPAEPPASGEAQCVHGEDRQKRGSAACCVQSQGERA